MFFAAIITWLEIINISLTSPVLFRDTDNSNATEHNNSIVDIINGTYSELYLNSFDQDIFLGMRFAQPPTDSLRFVTPQSIKKPFSEVRDDIEYLPECLSSRSLEGNLSEDSLGINVARLHNISGPLPVLVWIYGGSFTTGAGDQYNLSYFVQESVLMGKPIIGVTFNYRVGGFGLVMK